MMRNYALVSTDLSESSGLELAFLSSPTDIRIGRNPKIRQPAVFYDHICVGDNFETGHFVLIRENTVIGNNARIGSYTEIDGDCVIGDQFSCHSRCHISKYVTIGDNVRFMFNVTTLNDHYPPYGRYDPPRIGSYVLVASHVVLMPGSIVEPNSFIPAHTVVKGVWKTNWDAYERMLRWKGVL